MARCKTKSKGAAQRSKAGLAQPPMPQPALPPPTADEKTAIAGAHDRIRQRRPRVSVKIEADEAGKPGQLDAPHEDRAGMLSRLQDAFGSRGLAFTTVELNHLMNAAKLTDGKIDQTRLNGMLAVVDSVRPSNEIEGMLASQIAVTHGLAMKLMCRADTAQQLPQFESAGRMATKFLGAFVAQVDLLHRLQRGPSQIVRVEHVHVHSGGQALVGNVSRETAPPGREEDKIRSQPHAKAELPAPAIEAMPSLRRADAQREPMPLSGRAG